MACAALRSVVRAADTPWMHAFVSGAVESMGTAGPMTGPAQGGHWTRRTSGIGAGREVGSAARCWRRSPLPGDGAANRWDASFAVTGSVFSATNPLWTVQVESGITTSSAGAG